MANLEEKIQGLRDSGDLRGAATEAIEGYGREVFGLLVALIRDERDASEVFSQACEDLWLGIGRFEGRSSMRTWFYTLARHAASRFRRAAHRRPGRHVPLSEGGQIADQVRSRTQPHLRTDVKDRFAAIRDSLEEDDRVLLALRLDREMSWKEIARVFSAEDDPDETISRSAARLRKRFQVVKDEIRARARQAGLLRDDES